MILICSMNLLVYCVPTNTSLGDINTEEVETHADDGVQSTIGAQQRNTNV